jgi:protein-tyrosine phosphatase
MIDLHCHILPGVDDGPKTLDESLTLCELLINEGVTTVVTTPHLFHLRFEDPTSEKVNQLVKTLNRELGGRLQVVAGAEVRLVPEVVEEIDQSSAVTGRNPTPTDNGRRTTDHCLFLNGSHYILVEFPHDLVPYGIENLIFELTSRGVKPIIAHPERTRVFTDQPERLAELIRLGAYGQVDAPFLAGDHGSKSKKTALRWISQGYVHFVASDAHSCHRRPPRLQKAFAEVQKEYGLDVARSLFVENPKAVVNDEEVALLFELELAR